MLRSFVGKRLTCRDCSRHSQLVYVIPSGIRIRRNAWCYLLLAGPSTRARDRVRHWSTPGDNSQQLGFPRFLTSGLSVIDIQLSLSISFPRTGYQLQLSLKTQKLDRDVEVRWKRSKGTARKNSHSVHHTWIREETESQNNHYDPFPKNFCLRESSVLK